MKNIFTLESGVVTTTPTTAQFFNEVKEFYLTIVVGKDGNKYATVESVEDPTRCWYSSAIQEITDAHNGYVKIQTHNTVLQLWSDTYCNDIYNIIKPVLNWREYKWTYFFSDAFEAIMDRKIKLNYDPIIKCFRVWCCNDKSEIYDVEFGVDTAEEAHEVLRLLIMADIFCDECGCKLQACDPESMDDYYCITLKNKEKNFSFSLFIKRGRLNITFNQGATSITVDKNQTIDDVVERLLRSNLFPR
jgi:hypothetical protein